MNLIESIAERQRKLIDDIDAALIEETKSIPGILDSVNSFASCVLKDAERVAGIDQDSAACIRLCGIILKQWANRRELERVNDGLPPETKGGAA